jgi:predicted transcriptional regulator
MKRIRRDRLKIYMDILLVLRMESRREKIVLTRIQLKSNVPFDRLKTYLLELKNLDLIQDSNEPKLTQKGLEYLTEYKKVQDFMKLMGLDYQ